MKAKSVEYVPGVGVDTSKFANVEIDRDKKRQELGIPVDKKLLISVGELLKMSDLFVFPSYREGLSVSVMEAMSSGLPVVCSNIRGNCELIDENGGVLFDPHSVDDCKNVITKALNSNMADMGKCNQVKASNFSYEKVHNKMKEIYKCLKAEL